MAIFTRSEFTNLAKSKLPKSSYGLALEALNEARNFTKQTATTSVFLSHKHDEHDLIKEAKTIFENLGISVYVDWADETMPEKTNGITAQKIKQKIQSLDKFVLLATNAAIASKWCNWEVGIGDAYKLHNNNIALIPLADNNGHWSGNEYLQIYPRIEKDNDNVFIKYPTGKFQSITDWLNNKSP